MGYAVFQTGRQRRIETAGSFSISGQLRYFNGFSWVEIAPFDGQHWQARFNGTAAFTKRGEVRITLGPKQMVPGGSSATRDQFSFRVYQPSLDNGDGFIAGNYTGPASGWPPTCTYHYGAYIGGIANGLVTVGTLTVPLKNGGDLSYVDWTVTGTFQLAVDVEEVFRILPDGTRQFYEVTRPGGRIIRKFTVAGNEYGTDAEILSRVQVEGVGWYDCRRYMEAVNVDSRPGATASVTSIAQSFTAGGVSGEPEPMSATSPYGSVSPNEVISTYDGTNSLHANFTLPRDIVVNGYIPTIGGLETTPVDVEIVSTATASEMILHTATGIAGSFSHTLTNRPRYQAYLMRGNGGLTLASDSVQDSGINTGKLQVRIKKESRVALGLNAPFDPHLPNADDGYLKARGMEWDSVRIAQPQQIDWEKAPWTGWSGSNAATAVDGTVLRVTANSPLASGQNAQASRDFLPAPGKWLVYRTLRLRIRSVGAATLPFRLTLSGMLIAERHVWFNGRTGDDGEWVERTFDVLQSANAWDDAHADIAFDQLPVGTVRLENLAAGGVYEVAWIRAERASLPLLTILPGGFEGITDGLKTLALAGRSPIASILYGVNSRSPGWAATDLLPPRQGKPLWADVTLAPGAVYLPDVDFQDSAGYVDEESKHHGGALWGHGVRQGNLRLIDEPMPDAGMVLPATDVFPTLTLYPGAGQSWRGGSFGPVSTVEWYLWHRRAAINGVVVADEPAAHTATLRRNNAPYALVGSDTPAAEDGYFATGLPYANRILEPPNDPAALYPLFKASLETQTGDGPAIGPPTLTGLGHGARVYVHFYYSEGVYFPLALSAARSAAYAAEDKKGRAYHLQDWTQISASVDHAVDKWASFAFDERRATLLMLGKVGAAFQVFRSTDGGLTVTGGISVTATSGAIAAAGELGQLVLIYSTGGLIYRRLSDDGGVTWTAAEQATDAAGAALTGKVASLVYDRSRNSLYMTRKDGTDYSIWQSTQSGKSWTQRLA